MTFEQKLTAYRIIQEQIRNIVKHSRAGKAVISLQRENENLVLRIEDDGIGFDDRQTWNGLGLINISNRVEAHKGIMRIQSSPSKGCVIEAVIPITDLLL